jgi:predicted phage tail protein
LTAAASSSAQINLSWADNSTNEDGFKIERCAGASCSFSQIATVGANVTTYSNTGLSANTAYSYQVRAYNAGGDSENSNVATATTPAPPLVPAIPINLATTTASKNSVRLTWTDVANNEEGYKIERCTGSGCTNFSQIASVPANTTTYLNTGLRKATTYLYRVRSYNAGGNSDYSNTASYTTAR